MTDRNYVSIESALAVYEFGFYELGFQRSHFEVNRDNLKVIKFHIGFGASVTSFDDVNYYFLKAVSTRKCNDSGLV